jgi:hypothetical protein
MSIYHHPKTLRPFWTLRLLLLVLGGLGLCRILLYPTMAFAAEVTLAWDANTEPGLAGYRVYYKTGSSGPPYDGTGATPDDSPITVPLADLDNADNPYYTISKLNSVDNYFFAVTAYYPQDLESGYSEEVCFHFGGKELPIADAGQDQALEEGDTVTLDGSNSADKDGSVASYFWTQRSGIVVTLSNSTAAQPEFTAPEVDSNGKALTFELTVTDNDGLYSRDTCIVNVTQSGGNQPPIADAGQDQTLEEGDTVTLDGSASKDNDDEDDIASYLWRQRSGTTVSLSDSSAVQATFVAPTVGPSGDILTFQLKVTDRGGLSYTDSVVITVEDDTSLPTITGTNPQDKAGGISISSNVAITFNEAMDKATAENAFGIDPDVPGTFSWSDNTLVFDPGSNFAYSTPYTTTIAATAEDEAGNPLDGDGDGAGGDAYTFTFTTQAPPGGGGAGGSASPGGGGGARSA